MVRMGMISRIRLRHLKHDVGLDLVSTSVEEMEDE
jgi:hypothetical protein